MPGYLSEIVAAHRAAARADRRPLDDLLERASAAPPPRRFGRALGDSASSRGLAVIAEIKRRSPSRGDLAPDLDPSTAAVAYAAGGAACLSVLTDRQFFGGSADDLVAARRAVDLPVLRKDFTVAPADLCDARLMGADAVLLIAAVLTQGELVSLAALAGDLGLDALVEVHDEVELARALDAGARLVGVNQRDLVTFEVDPDRAGKLAASIPADVVAVAESGVAGPVDAARLAAAGYQAVLVGEHLLRSADRVTAVAGLSGHPIASRAGVPGARAGDRPSAHPVAAGPAVGSPSGS